MMELNYKQEGDYQIPDTTETVPELGRFGRLRWRYLEEQEPTTYSLMQMQGTLYPHLMEIDKQASAMMAQLIPEMAKREGVTEELKASDQMRWVGLMNNIRSAAEEIVLNELINN